MSSIKTRREFIKGLFGGTACLAILSSPFNPFFSAQQFKVNTKHIFAVKEAMYYEQLTEGEVQCKLCPKECTVGNRERGWCGVRENRDGTYYTMVHSNPCAVHFDPIEKAPFFHFLPASLAFSISTAGCNLNCKYCQNWEISQRRPEQTDNVFLPPDEVVRKAQEFGCKTVVYTYAEPVVCYEYVLDTAKACRNAGIRSAVVSAGYIQTEPLQKLCKTVDAVKIDLKSFNDKFYREICSGTLQPVLDTLKTLKKMGVWYEIVDLIIPTLNDTETEFAELAEWVMDNLGPDIPLHFSRFYAMYQLKNLPPTPMNTLERARQIAMETGLNYVYLGNVPYDHEGNNTYCPKCKKLLIQRKGLFVVQNNIVEGKCQECGHEIPGVWF